MTTYVSVSFLVVSFMCKTKRNENEIDILAICALSPQKNHIIKQFSVNSTFFYSELVIVGGVLRVMRSFILTIRKR